MIDLKALKAEKNKLLNHALNFFQQGETVLRNLS